MFFVDNGQIIGSIEVLARLAARQLAANLQWRWVQEIARKRRQETMRAGMWAGTVVFTDQRVVWEFISEEKWDRARVEMHWFSGLWLTYEQHTHHMAWNVAGVVTVHD
jgi:hypothetical protein